MSQQATEGVKEFQSAIREPYARPSARRAGGREERSDEAKGLLSPGHVDPLLRVVLLVDSPNALVR